MGVPILLSSKTQENFVTVWSRHTAAEWRFDMETKKNNGISEYGELVRQKLRASELTEENLAERIEMSDRQIRNIEKGITIPKLDTVIKIGTALDMNLGELNALGETKGAI